MRTSSTYVRLMVFKRDRGVCAKCGMDAHGLELRIRERHAIRYREYTDRKRMFMPWGYWRFNGGTPASRRRLIHITSGIAIMPTASKKAFADITRLKLRIGLAIGRKTFWDADHIQTVADGGGMCGLDNIQTLCFRCHAAKTFNKP